MGESELINMFSGMVPVSRAQPRCEFVTRVKSGNFDRVMTGRVNSIKADWIFSLKHTRDIIVMSF